MSISVTHLVAIVDDNTNICVSGAGAVEVSCSPLRRSTRPVVDSRFEKNLRIVSSSIIGDFGQVYIQHSAINGSAQIRQLAHRSLDGSANSG